MTTDTIPEIAVTILATVIIVIREIIVILVILAITAITAILVTTATEDNPSLNDASLIHCIVG